MNVKDLDSCGNCRFWVPFSGVAKDLITILRESNKASGEVFNLDDLE